MALEIVSASTQYITCGNAVSLQITDTITVLIWFKTTATTAWSTLLAKDSVNAGKRCWSLCRNSYSTPAHKGLLYIHDSNDAYYVETDAAINDGNLHCMVGTFDGTMRIYLDGVLQADTDATPSAIDNDAVEVSIGAEEDGRLPADAPLFNARVYNRALSLAEIKSIYYSQGADNIVNGLVGRWLMNERADGVSAVIPALSETDNVDDIVAFQGVATDGSNLYISTSSAIVKRTMAGVFVAEVTDTHLEGTDMAQTNHLCIHDGKIYIGANNYDTEPKLGYIKVFNLSDLSYDTEHQVLAHWCEGCAYHDGYFWVVYTDYKFVSKYNTSWEHQADYAVDYVTTGDAKIIGYQGITWKDNDIYCTIHDGASPSPTVDRYHWNGAEFVQSERLIPPAEADQGLCYLSSNDRFYIAQRNHPGAGDHSVTITELVGSWVIDVSGSGNNGTPVNSPVYRAASVRLVKPVTMVT